MSENVIWNSQWSRGRCSPGLCKEEEGHGNKALRLSHVKWEHVPCWWGAEIPQDPSLSCKVSSMVSLIGSAQKWGKNAGIFRSSVFILLRLIALWVSPLGLFLCGGGIPALLRWDRQSYWVLITNGPSSKDRRHCIWGLLPSALLCCVDSWRAHKPLLLYGMMFNLSSNLYYFLTLKILWRFRST